MAKVELSVSELISGRFSNILARFVSWARVEK